MKKILNPKPVKKAVKKSVKRTGRALVNNNPPMEKVKVGGFAELTADTFAIDKGEIVKIIAESTSGKDRAIVTPDGRMGSINIKNLKPVKSYNDPAPKTLKSISVKSAGFVMLLKNQDKEIWWQCKSLNGEILSTCETMHNKADVLQNMILTHKLLGKMIKEMKG